MAIEDFFSLFCYCTQNGVTIAYTTERKCNSKHFGGLKSPAYIYRMSTLRKIFNKKIFLAKNLYGENFPIYGSSSSKHFRRWSIILALQVIIFDGSSPNARQVQTTIANTSQSLPPCCFGLFPTVTRRGLV